MFLSNIQLVLSLVFLVNTIHLLACILILFWYLFLKTDKVAIKAPCIFIMFSSRNVRRDKTVLFIYFIPFLKASIFKISIDIVNKNLNTIDKAKVKDVQKEYVNPTK